MQLSTVLTTALLLVKTTMAANLNIVAVGASITNGVGSVGGNGYRDDFFHALEKAGHKVHMVGTQKSGNGPQRYSEGYPGFTIDQVKAKITTTWNKLQYPPNVIVTLVGTNDQRAGQDAAGSVARFNGLLDEYRKLCADCVIVASTLPPNGKAAQNANIDKYNAGITKVVNDRRAGGEHILISNGNAGLKVAADLAGDKIHPNNKGYSVIAARLAEQVESAIAMGWVAAPQKFKKRDLWGARAKLNFGTTAA